MSLSSLLLYYWHIINLYYNLITAPQSVGVVFAVVVITINKNKSNFNNSNNEYSNSKKKAFYFKWSLSESILTMRAGECGMDSR